MILNPISDPVSFPLLFYIFFFGLSLSDKMVCYKKRKRGFDLVLFNEVI